MVGTKRTVLSIITIIACTVIIVGGFLGAYVLKRIEQRESAGPAFRQDISVTIIEGKRREEIAALLQEKGICSAAAFLAATTTLEGQLFPDTYRFFPDTPVADILAEFQRNFAKKTLGQTPTPDQIILASIIEREAQNDSERTAIAGVYTNRIAAGMKLDADPTVQYAKDSLNYISANSSVTFTFWSPITQADYALQSPYNTYAQAGLPPTAIANPGLPSIIAAMNPDKSNYYYFFHRNGTLYLSKTLSEQTSKLQSIPRN